MTFERIAAPLRRRPPSPLPAVALCAAAGAAFAQGTTGPAVVAIAELALRAEADALATASIALSRAGAPGRRITFRVTPSATSCDTPSPIAWLAAGPSTGEIEAGAIAILSVYASGFGAPAPRRTGFLCVSTDDDARAPREISVVLTVGAAAPAVTHPEVHVRTRD